MTAPRDPDADRGRWGDEDSPLIERHPGFDRYPPANQAARRPVRRGDEPELPDFLARRTPDHPAEPYPGDRPAESYSGPAESHTGERPTESYTGNRPAESRAGSGAETRASRTSRWSRRRRTETAQPEPNPPRQQPNPSRQQPKPPAPRESAPPTRRFATERPTRPYETEPPAHGSGTESRPGRFESEPHPGRFESEPRTGRFEERPPYPPEPQAGSGPRYRPGPQPPAGPPAPSQAARLRGHESGHPPPARPDATRGPQPGPHHPEDTRLQSHPNHPGDDATTAGLHKPPRKLTVTRVAARRSIELTERGFATFQRAAKADGAEESGLTALVYATMANFATDAAVAVALANTLFFASATAESKTKVALYLLITIAPFGVIAPVIGPMLDRLQRGRRLALAGSFALRVLIAGLLIFNIDNWALYPLALCMLILSKSFSVLKSAVTPRVLPPGIDLVRTNSRLTVFGLVGGTLGAGAIAAAIAFVAHSTGALLFAAVLAAAGAYLSLNIPSWVEDTEGEVPATIGYHGEDSRTEVLEPSQAEKVKPSKRRQPLGRSVVTGLWGNGTVRILTGFLFFYIPFVIKSSPHHATQQVAMAGLAGAAAAIGNFAGNATGARMKLGRPQLIVLTCTISCVAAAVLAAVLGNMIGVIVAALVASCTSALAKVSLDASIQDDLPPESVASGFGRSETVLQLAWVLGGAMGVLLPTEWWKGFAVVSAVMALGLTQTVVSYRGHSLLPGLGGNRPQHAKQEIHAHGAGEPTQ